VRAALTGRALLLVQDRADVAAAARADGVVLTAGGVPPAVAAAGLTAGYGRGGLVAAVAGGAGAARRAAAAGAGALLLQPPATGATADAVDAARNAVISGGSVPLVLDLSAPGAWRRAAAARGGAVAGADGVAVGPGDVVAAAAALFEAIAEAEAPLEPAATVAAPAPAPPPLPLLADALAPAAAPDVAALRADEAATLAAALAFLRAAVPDMAETDLLADAAAALANPFLLVVAGEFNAGKSTLINALLGGRFLDAGVLPTTNEVALLVYGEGGDGGERAGGGDAAPPLPSGGATVRRLPAPLLRALHVVDTPGTNAVVGRQAALAQEFVPRADLVLFTLSADRPLCASEATFLRYIASWGKKVAFVVNKIDALPDADSVAAVCAFVAASARDAAGIDAVAVLPVSARGALAAKEEAAAAGGAPLAASPAWAASRFAPLEAFVASFVAAGAGAAADGDAVTAAAALAPAVDAPDAPGAGARAGEGARLKLDTPLYVASALLAAAATSLDARVASADADAGAVAAVAAQVAAFGDGMRRDGGAQRAAAARVVGDGLAAALTVVDGALTLSNIEGLLGYALGRGEGPAKRAAGDGLARAAASLSRAAADHRAWLDANAAAQLDNYCAFARRRGAALGVGEGELGAAEAAARAALEAGVAAGAGAPAGEPESRESAALAPTAPPPTALAASTSPARRGAAAAAVAAFDPAAAALLLDADLRESAAGTAAGVGGAALLGACLTAILPTFAEDALALALAAAAAYLALINLPLRRGDAKAKARRAAANFGAAVDGALAGELEGEVRAVAAAVAALTAPLAAAASARAAAARAARDRCAALAAEVAALRRRAAAVGR